MRKYLFAILALLLTLLFSCSDSDNLDVVLVDNPALEAGEYAVKWGQGLDNGAPAPEGIYRIDMDTDNFNASLYIEITSFDLNMPLTKTEDTGISLKPIPDSYGLRVNKAVFVPGEEVEIGYDLPQSDRIKITISWINLNISPLL
jgi:hypothetical protein